MTRAGTLVWLAAIVTVVATLGAQQAVEPIAIDVAVVDSATGKPFGDLTTADFTLTVDGKPRKVATAEYVTTAGRQIMLVVDQGNIGTGRGRTLLDAASKFVSRLGSADRVGLMAIPSGAAQIDFTSNHSSVATMLPKLVGQASPVSSQHRIGISEAYRLQRGDNLALNQIVKRECASAGSPQQSDACRNQIIADAQAAYSASRERTRTSLAALRAVVERLALTPTPKTLVFISESTILDRDPEETSWIGPLAVRGQLTVYALQMEEPPVDAASRPTPTPREDLALVEEGLTTMTGLARGSVLRIAGNADAALNRIALESSGHYLLRFEPDAGDRDGKAHKIKIAAPTRANADVRARHEFSAAGATTNTEDSVLAELLQSQVAASEIKLELSAFTLRDPSSEKLRIMLAAEIDRSLNAADKLSLAYTLTDEKGRVVGSQIERDVKAPIQEPSKKQTYTGFAVSDAIGAHTLKLAIVDDKGRRGSIAHPFSAGLTGIGQIKVGDLLIADSKRVPSENVTPVVAGDLTSGTLHAYVELYASTPGALDNASVVFEIAQGDDGRALDGAAGRLQPPAPESPARRVAEGSLPLGLLTPGRYLVRAAISVDGKRIGQVSRTVRVGRTIAPVKTTSAAPGLRAVSATVPIVFTSRIERFERSSVLAPQVVGFFLDRLRFDERAEPNRGRALEHARSGRFDEAVKSLSVGTGTLPASFLSGLALYAKGDLEPAAAKFRETLRIDSEFFPAAFYLGSCYAAGGRDSEAVGAWQLSLITQSEAPFIYTLLGDALIRMREINQALEILNEAAAAWPDNDEVQVRIGAALAMSGKRGDALQKLEPYLAKHPDDHERLLIALRALHDARVEGKAVRSRDEDRALFDRWSAAYAEAKGPQQALVDQWKRAVAK